MKDCNCGNCEFMGSNKDSIKETEAPKFFCHSKSPVPFMFMIPVQSMAGGVVPQFITHSVFPPINLNEWCGDWKPRISKE